MFTMKCFQEFTRNLIHSWVFEKQKRNFMKEKRFARIVFFNEPK